MKLSKFNQANHQHILPANYTNTYSYFESFTADTETLISVRCTRHEWNDPVPDPPRNPINPNRPSPRSSTSTSPTTSPSTPPTQSTQAAEVQTTSVALSTSTSTMMSTSFMEPQPDADRQRSSDKSKGRNDDSIAMAVGMIHIIWRSHIGTYG